MSCAIKCILIGAAVLQFALLPATMDGVGNVWRSGRRLKAIALLARAPALVLVLAVLVYIELHLFGVTP